MTRLVGNSGRRSPPIRREPMQERVMNNEFRESSENVSVERHENVYIHISKNRVFQFFMVVIWTLVTTLFVKGLIGAIRETNACNCNEFTAGIGIVIIVALALTTFVISCITLGALVKDCKFKNVCED